MILFFVSVEKDWVFVVSWIFQSSWDAGFFLINFVQYFSFKLLAKSFESINSLLHNSKIVDVINRIMGLFFVSVCSKGVSFLD